MRTPDKEKHNSYKHDSDETSLIPTFFLEQFVPGDIRCKSFVPMFDKLDTSRNEGKLPRFSTLFGESSNPLPGNWAWALSMKLSPSQHFHPSHRCVDILLTFTYCCSFSGADRRINSLKGVMFNPALTGWPPMKSVTGLGAAQAFDELFQTWNNA